jgi:hypothetical protein
MEEDEPGPFVSRRCAELQVNNEDGLLRLQVSAHRLA